MTTTMRPAVYYPSQRVCTHYAWSYAEDTMLRGSDNASNDTLRALLDIPGYRVMRPIPYHVEIVDGETVAVDDAFDRYGAGTTLAQAKDELASQLSDYFDTLSSDVGNLAKCALHDYRRMARYVSRSAA